MAQRKIIHVDMDAFYASVEQRDNPVLRGRPVVVGHDGPRGVVATASYEARPYGIHSAMAVATAKRRCAGLIVVEPRFEAYKAVSETIRNIFLDYTTIIEPLSLDEAFLDVSHHPSATIVARDIKRRIAEVTGLTASAGVSVNKMLAKIASDYRKPDGLTVITPSDIDDFVAGLPVEKFFGIGEVTAERMHRIGIFTGADLRSQSEARLVSHFGKAGHDYYLYARGIDNRPVVTERTRKSVGAETTFIEDTDNRRILAMELNGVRRDVMRRMERSQFRGRTVVLKLKYDDFRQITRSRTLPHPVEDDDRLREISESLLADTDFDGHKVRLIGLTVANPVVKDHGDGPVQLEFDFGEY